MNNEKRGNFLKKLRKSKNLTQQQLGELINYSDKNISKWENGYSFPTDPEALTKLSNIFEVSIEEILYGDYENKDNKEKIKENILNIYTKNYNEKKFLKRSIAISIIIFLVIIIVLLLTIYFNFIKGEIKSYKITGNSENIDVIEGSLLISNKINILEINKIETQREIDYIYFYIKDENENKIIFSGENDNYYIEEHKGSMEYNLKSILPSNTYIEVLYTDGSDEIIKLNIEEKFINDKIFTENISQEDEKNIINNSNLFILEEHGFTKEKDYLIKKINNIEIYYYSDKFEIVIKEDSKIEKISKNIHSSNIIHEIIEKDKINNKQIIEKENIDCDNEKCDTEEDYYKYLNFLSDLITN